LCRYEEQILFSGSLLALDGNIVAFSQPVKLEPEETAELELEIGLDIRAGNWYKGKNIDYTITVYAFQESDQEIGGCAIIADESNYQEKISQAQLGDAILLKAGSYDEIELSAAVVLKAKDVVYDVAVDRIRVDDGNSSEEHENPTRIQGMTLNVNGTSFAVQINNTQELIISDNIIYSKGIAINGGNKETVIITRNDLAGTNKPYNPGANQPKAFYNLGDDLDPEEHAL
jgi:hypothetical protein